MAEPRRRSGYLRETVLRVLENAGRPVSALEIREMVLREGFTVPPSLVFRAVRQLVVRGAIRKIHLARGYCPGDGQAAIALVCGQCGRVTEIACDEIFQALDRVAGAEGFAASRHVVEVPGVCRDCSGQSRI